MKHDWNNIFEDTTREDDSMWSWDWEIAIVMAIAVAVCGIIYLSI